MTVTLRPKAKLVPYTTKAGYTVTVPSDWSLAYDRSADEKVGTQAFWGNFRTVETLAVLLAPKPEGDLTPQQLLSAVLAEQQNNVSVLLWGASNGDTHVFKLLQREVVHCKGLWASSEAQGHSFKLLLLLLLLLHCLLQQSAYDFKLISGDTPTQRTAPTADGTGEDVYWDSEYMLAICRGAIQEGSGGTKRCIGPRDMDLVSKLNCQLVSQIASTAAAGACGGC